MRIPFLSTLYSECDRAELNIAMSQSAQEDCSQKTFAMPVGSPRSFVAAGSLQIRVDTFFAIVFALLRRRNVIFKSIKSKTGRELHYSSAHYQSNSN